VTDKPSSLAKITTLGGLLGIKTAPVIQRLMPLVGSWSGPLIVTIPHRFNALSITANVDRATAATLCPWLDALVGDRIDLELGTTTTVAHSDEAALPADAPAPIHALGDDLASVSWDGEAWTYEITQLNTDEAAVAATIARFLPIAQSLRVTEAQRKISANLHRSLNRGMPTRTWLRARNGELDPIVGLAFDEVEWLPIQHMMNGFYPEIDSPTKIARLSRAVGLEQATVELILGPLDPPGMRILVPVE
jgi:hypothetical protein